nr:ribonuclease H-like domain-containing protein [Tanacetum cinerariifolium]
MVFLWLQSLAVVTICYYTKRDWDIPSSVVVGSLAMDGPSTISAAGDFTGSGGVLTIVLQSGTNVCASGLKHVTTAVAVPSSIIALKQYLFVVVMSLALGSSAETEYKGVANVVAETAWLRNLLLELHTPLLSATIVYCDNVSAIYMIANLVQHQRTKHIEIDIHFVRDMVACGQVRVLYVLSRYQYANIFTNGLPSTLFEEFRSSLSVRSSPTQTAGEC